jgi:hypothetical protein
MLLRILVFMMKSMTIPINSITPGKIYLKLITTLISIVSINAIHFHPRTLIPEEDFLDAGKYADYHGLVNDFMDDLHPETL